MLLLAAVCALLALPHLRSRMRRQQTQMRPAACSLLCRLHELQGRWSTWQGPAQAGGKRQQLSKRGVCWGMAALQRRYPPTAQVSSATVEQSPLLRHGCNPAGHPSFLLPLQHGLGVTKSGMRTTQPRLTCRSFSASSLIASVSSPDSSSFRGVPNSRAADLHVTGTNSNGLCQSGTVHLSCQQLQGMSLSTRQLQGCPCPVCTQAPDCGLPCFTTCVKPPTPAQHTLEAPVTTCDRLQGLCPDVAPCDCLAAVQPVNQPHVQHNHAWQTLKGIGHHVLLQTT